MSTSSSSPPSNGAVPPQTIDVKSCTPKQLASSLIIHRPGGSKPSLDFLKETILILEKGQTSSHSAAAAAAAATTNPVEEDVVDLGPSLLEEPFEGSFVSPRLGKFNIQLFDGGLRATKTNDATVQVNLPATSCQVSHVVVFPKPEDCKTLVKSGGTDLHKTTGNLVIVRFHEPMNIQKKQVQQLCFTLPSQKKIGPTGPKMTMEAAKIITKKGQNDDDDGIDGNNNNDPTTAWCQLLCHAMSSSSSSSDEGSSSNISLAQIQPGRPGSFQSFQLPNTSTTSGGMPFVNCYSGVNDGVLYPLREGLLFFKPPRFIPRSELHSISCGRGGGGSSRYVDMNVTLNDNDDDDDKNAAVEFTNIQREENPVLNAYIHNVLIPAMQQDASANEAEKEPLSSSSAEEVVIKSVTNEEDIEQGSDDDDVVEADLADDDDATDSSNSKEDSDDDDDDDDDEDFDDDDDDSGEDDDDVFGNNAGGNGDDDDDDGFTVVRDEFAKSLVKKKQEEGGEGSATESEDDDDDKPRKSKRLRQF